MKFEEALAALREGAKIRHPSFEKDVYLMACRIGIVGDNAMPFHEKPISIVKMNGENQHEEMARRMCYVGRIKRQLKKILTKEDYMKYHNIYTEMAIGDIFDNSIFQFPQLNLLLLMSDDWEIKEEK